MVERVGNLYTHHVFTAVILKDITTLKLKDLWLQLKSNFNDSKYFSKSVILNHVICVIRMSILDVDLRPG